MKFLLALISTLDMQNLLLAVNNKDCKGNTELRYHYI